MDYQQSHREILLEFSCDYSELSKADRFYDFYEDMNALNLGAVARPQADLMWLFRLPAASMPVLFESFRQALQKYFLAASRSSYMCKQNPDHDFSATEMCDFTGRYPRYATIDQKDVWFLAPKSNSSKMVTLAMRARG
jgi:hypothetical protein